MPTRRTLHLDSLDDVRADLDGLLAHGYDRAGNWDLAQTCGHLTEWLRYPMDGYPTPPWFARPVLWLLRHTVIPGQVRKVLATGTLPDGGPTMKQTIPPPGGDEAQAVAHLKATIDRWQSHTGPLHASPLFGSMSRADWNRLQLIHIRHHLRFLVPKAEASP
jgi:hypothetical protein